MVQEPDRPDGPVRVGRVLSRKGGTFHVRWEDDGAEENLRLGGRTAAAPRGSLRLDFLLDRAAAVASFDADPVPSVLRLLQEYESGLTRRQIREKLNDVGLDVDSRGPRWKRIERVLTDSDNVEMSGKAAAAVFTCKPARKCRKEAPERSAPDATWPQAEQPSPVPPVSGAPTGRGLLENVAQDTETAEQPPSAQPTGAEWPESVMLAPRSAEEPTPVGADEPAPAAKQPPLTKRLAEATGEDESQPLRYYLSKPLAIGARLRELTNEQVDVLVNELGDDDARALGPLLLALPRPSAGADRLVGALGGEELTLLLAAAAAEVQAYADPDPGLRSAAAAMLHCTCTANDLPTSAIPSLFTLAAAVAAGPAEEHVSVVDRVAMALSRLLPSMSRDERNNLDLDRFAPVVTGLPLTPDGGRAALIAAVGRVRSKSVLQDAWWAGASLDDLVACAAGPLGAVTSRSEVAAQYLHPLVLRELSVVESRGRLAVLLGLPREFLAGVPGDVVAAAFRRVAAIDPVVAGWTAALTQEQRVESLRRGAEQAQAVARAADERVQAAEGRAAILADRCNQLEEMLRAEHRESASLRSAQDRQIQIDVIRSLAELAAEVEELAADGAEAEVLIERTRALVMAQVLEPIGSAGQKLSFDPTVHDPIVGGPASGTDVTVIRPGYRWRPPGEDVLIAKALVTT